MYQIEFEIPNITPSNNTALREHRFARNASNREWYRLVGAAVNGKRPVAPLGRAHVSVVRLGHRLLDFDNLVGGFKAVVDGLKHAQIIKDDSWKVIGAWSVDQVQVPKKTPQTIRITVTGMVGP